MKKRIMIISVLLISVVLTSCSKQTTPVIVGANENSNVSSEQPKRAMEIKELPKQEFSPKPAKVMEIKLPTE